MTAAILLTQWRPKRKLFEFIIDERTIISELASSKQINYGIQSGLMIIAGVLLLIQAGISTWGGADIQCNAVGSATQEKDNLFLTKVLSPLTKSFIPSKAEAKDSDFCANPFGIFPDSNLDESAVRTMPYVLQMLCGAATGGLIAGGIAFGGAETLFNVLIKGAATSWILGFFSTWLGISYAILSSEYGKYSESLSNKQ